MQASALASIRFSVSGVSGQVSATMSAWPQQLGQPVVGRSTASASPPPWLGSRLVAITRMSNALAELGQPRADAAQADDQQGLAAELVLARGDVGDHAAPDAWLPGCRGSVWSWRLQGQDQRHRVLGHGVGVDAGGAGEADAVRAQHLLIVLVDAGADRLDEFQLAWRCAPARSSTSWRPPARRPPAAAGAAHRRRTYLRRGRCRYCARANRSAMR